MALPNEVQLIHYEERHILHMLALFPAPAENVPLLWRRDGDICL